MIKRLFTATRITATVLMVVSTITPIQMAEASGTITKQVTVIGIDGQPYAGALVGMKFQAVSGASIGTNAITPVLTNSSGVATLTYADNLKYGELTVEPPATDTETAVWNSFYSDNENSSPITVNLRKALVRVNVITHDNLPAPIYSGVANGWREFAYMIRSGAVNIAYPDSAVNDTCKKFSIFPSEEAIGSFRRIYGSKVTGSGETRTAKIYNDPGSCSIEAPKIDGVYQLKFNAGNISGSLLSNSGTPLSFASNEGYEIQVNALNSDGTTNEGVQYTYSSTRSDGSWASYVDTSTAGKYQLTFFGYGNPNLPTFTNKFFWVTPEGKLSWSVDGSNSADVISGNFNLPLPNFKINYVDSATGLNIPVNVEIDKKIGNSTSFDFRYGWSYLDGQPTTFLEDGQYVVLVSNYDGNNTVSLYVTVTSGVVVLTNSSGDNFSYSNGIYNIWKPISNAKFQLKDSGNNPVMGRIDFCGKSNCYGLSADSSGNASTFIPDGTYSQIWVNPLNAVDLGGMILTGSVTNGVLTISGKSAVNGIYTLTLPTANIKFNVTHPTNGSAISNGWIGVESADSNWNPIGWVGNVDISGSTPGYARGYLPDGRYLLTVNVQAWDVNNAGLAGRTYQVTVTNGVPTISFNGTQLAAQNGKFPVSPASANLEVTVNNLSGTPITDGWIDVCSDLGSGNTGSCRGVGFNQSGQASQSLANGNWVIVVRPGSSTGMSAKTYTATVTNGVVSITGLTKTNGRWILTGAAPNITGSFSLSSGSLTFGNNMGISLSVQKYNNGNWEWQNGGSWVQATNFALNITAQGRYRIVANPINFTDLVQSYSNEFWVNGSAQLSTSQNGTYSDSLTAFNILIKSPNLRLKVLNPIDNSLLPAGWVSIFKINGQNKNWISNADIFNQNPGLTGTNLAEVGQYTMTVNPPNGSNAIVGLAAREYQLTVEANDSMTVTLGGAPVAIENGRFVVAPATANVTARIMKSDGTAFGNSNGKWVNANLQKLNQYNNWEWSSTWANADQDGYISMRADAPGTYRLRIEPQGDSDATVTYSSEFVVTSDDLNTFKKEFGNIALVGPSIRVSVATPANSSTAVSYANIEIRKDGNWVDWANTSRSGIAGISLKTAGTYEFIVNPTNDLQGTTSRKAYKITATANEEGVITATAAAGTGVSVADGVTTLLLGSPTLSGTVKEPGISTTVVANSQVVAVTASGQELWEYSASSNSSGVWSMSLPAGTYKIKARTPWGSALYGDSDLSGDVVVDATGAAITVPGGQSATSFLLRLKSPTWSGVVKNPAGTAVIPNARVCLLMNNNWNCANADANGGWALSAPAGFTSFTGTNPILEINDDFGRQYPMKRFEGAAAVNTAIGTSGSGIVLQFADANTQITVTAGGNPVANVWVSAERDGSGWLGGATTNSSGVAKLNITSPSSAFKIRVELNGNPTVSSSYATTMKTFSTSEISAGTSNSVFSATVALNEPNFKVVLREPTSDGSVGTAIPYSWIELYSETTGTWLGGASTDANGFAAFKLDAPVSGINSYVVTVNPAWNASTNFSRQAYAVAVSATAPTITVIKKTAAAPAINSQIVSGRTVYPLTLGIPSVTGIVVDPNGASVANSWISPRDAVTGQWLDGVSSRRGGEFGINLAGDTQANRYTLEANVPWGTSNLAKSASCEVTVQSGTISTGGACIQDGVTKTVRLALRPPNLTFTLKIGGVAVANANIGIGAGKWYTNAQSDSQGNVSLFVDAVAIRSLNGYSTAQPLYVWVDPPYGGDIAMARWDCASTSTKPICSGLVNVPATGDYPTTALGDVTGVSPNTRIKIVAPGTSTELANSWVTVLAFDPANPNNRRWLGGANSNSSGYASMNLETSTVSSSWRFAVEINAPWNQRQLYATNYDNNSGTGFTWSELTNALVTSPKAPNLTLTINAANSVANKFGWIGVEEVNSSDNTVAWVVGTGLNENGVASIFLAASKRYRITANPGQGKSGARTTCIVTTNVSEVVSAVAGKCDQGTFTSGAATVTLADGNIVGRVTKVVDGVTVPVIGAIIYANNPNATDESTAVITSTDTDGRYGLHLDTSKTWNIKVFPVGADKSALGTGSLTGVTPPSSGYTTTNFTIAAA